MTALHEETYAERNQRVLVAALSRVYSALATPGERPAPPAEAVEPPPDSRLAQLVEMFGLSGFECDVLLWCAGVELDGRFPTAFGVALGDPRRTAPTFGLALSTLDSPHWDALTPDSPLRRWRLVELGAGVGLVYRPLQIDERILHYLAGVTCLDPRLDGVLAPWAAPIRLTPRQAGVAAEVLALLDRMPAPVTAVLDGADTPTRRGVAARIAAASGRLLLVLPAALVPAAGTDAAALARLVEREVALLDALLLIEYAESGDPAAVAGFRARLGCQVLVSGARHAPGSGQTAGAPYSIGAGHPIGAGYPTGAIRRTVPEPTCDERLDLWRMALGARSAGYGSDLAEMAEHFRFSPAAVDAVAAELAVTDPAGGDVTELQLACRTQARSGLEDLAERVMPYAGWSDLVLPDPAIEVLQDIARQVRHRPRVYHDWGMAGATIRGLGVSALFTGDSGTGKTLAAEVLAAELGLDLYRIDLAAVVSKYIGETEKNLKRIFEAAEASGAVLLFDEADALFGKRSEVKDSHDRYANLEISYLLQRMEAYRGLAILTTNLKTAVDRAFLRRIRFVVAFPFPDAAARSRIWRLMFPPALPLDRVDPDRLARLQLPGGNIRNIALTAAFLAAERGGPVTMADLLAAARRECAKLDRPLPDAEIGDWS